MKTRLKILIVVSLLVLIPLSLVGVFSLFEPLDTEEFLLNEDISMLSIPSDKTEMAQ